MWTRAELKMRAKICLRRYFWAAFAVSLIFTLLGGNGGNSGNAGMNTSGQAGYETGLTGDAGVTGGIGAGEMIGENVELPGGITVSPEGLPNLPSSIGGGHGNMATNLVMMIMTGAVVVTLVIALIFGIFLVPVLEVGRNRFYMESRLKKQSAGIGKVFWGFQNGYLKIVGAQFLRGFIISAVVFGLMAPGMIMMLLGSSMVGAVVMMVGSIVAVAVTMPLECSYWMVPFILSENPKMGARETLRLSREMMRGHKMSTFVLGLSFVGWEILGMLCFGIGIFFVQPYIDATFAELYAVLRKPYADRLGGFGIPDVVEADETVERPVREEQMFEGEVYVRSNGYGNDGDSYGQNESGYAQGGNGYGQDGQWQSGSASAEAEPEVVRDTEVKRSEGGPGRGYYLNGVFHPYTEEEEQDNGKQ